MYKQMSLPNPKPFNSSPLLSKWSPSIASKLLDANWPLPIFNLPNSDSETQGVSTSSASCWLCSDIPSPGNALSSTTPPSITSHLCQRDSILQGLWNGVFFQRLAWIQTHNRVHSKGLVLPSAQFPLLPYRMNHVWVTSSPLMWVHRGHWKHLGLGVHLLPIEQVTGLLHISQAKSSKVPVTYNAPSGFSKFPSHAPFQAFKLF